MSSRRKFLQISGATAASSLIVPRRAISRPMATSKVYTVHDDKLVTGNSNSSDVKNAKVDYDRVKSALDSIIMAMSGKANAVEAWKSFFAGATENSKLALKVNCLHDYNSPPWETLKALITCLKTVFKASNIYVFDNVWMGGTERVNISYKSADLDALGVWHGKCTYNGPIIKVGTESWRPTTQLADADFGISFGVYRQHCCHAGFLSAGIKNMIGAISQKTDVYSRVKSFHGNYEGGEPAWYKFADLFKNGMNDLVHLYITDWLFTCVDETKAVSKVTKRIAMSTDPCAIDSYTVDYYKSVGMLKSDKAGNKGVPKKLEDAGVGNTSYDLVPVTIGQVTSAPRICAPSKMLTISLWTPEYRYASANFPVLQNEHVDYIGVYNIYGRRMHAFRPAQQKRRIIWDGTTECGHRIAAGSYALRLKTSAGRTITQTISLSR